MSPSGFPGAHASVLCIHYPGRTDTHEAMLFLLKLSPLFSFIPDSDFFLSVFQRFTVQKSYNEEKKKKRFFYALVHNSNSLSGQDRINCTKDIHFIRNFLLFSLKKFAQFEVLARFCLSFLSLLFYLNHPMNVLTKGRYEENIKEIWIYNTNV